MGFGSRSRVAVITEKARIQSLLRSNENKVDWDLVRKFLRSQPLAHTEENTRCSTKDDPMGRVFIVDVIAKNPPVNAIEETLRAYPDALTLNVSAFFSACQLASPDVMRTLIRHCLKNDKRDMDVCPYPWIVLSHMTIQGTRVLLEEYPQGVLQGTVGGCSSNLCPLDYMLFSAVSMKKRAPDPQWWEKLKLMLMVAEHGTVKRGPHSVHPIHEILRRVVSTPEFFTDRKMSQHIVWLLHQLRLLEPLHFQEKNDDGDYPLQVVLRCKCHVGPCFAAARELIMMLIQVHPACARICNHEGRLPLHQALENGWPCHDVLLSAAPETLQTRDVKTGMYPFQTAALSNTSWNENKRARKIARVSALDVTYMLLREDPLQARGLVEG